MINEIMYLIKKKTFKYLIFSLAICVCIPLFRKQPSDDYKKFYRIYENQMELFESSDSNNLVPLCDEVVYIYEQIQYIRDIQNEIALKIEMLEGQLQSSLFKDDYKQLQKDLDYEYNRKNVTIDLYDTYSNNQLLNQVIPVYFIYAAAIFLFLSIFYEDIKNNQIQIFKTYRNSLSSIFRKKLFVYLLFLFIIAVVLMTIEIVYLKGNYSVYNVVSLSSTFTDLTLVEYVIVKYINAFFNALLITSILYAIIMLIRNEVIGYISLFLICMGSFFIFKTSKSLVKYFNLYYVLFSDRLQYNSINQTLFLVKIILIFILFVMIWRLYTKDYYLEINFQRRLHYTSTVKISIHILWELLVKSKGFATIVIILLFSLNNYRSFVISNDYKEQSYQSYIEIYIGKITDERYQLILNEYEKVQEEYKQFLLIDQQINEHPELAEKLMKENEEIIRSADVYDRITRLKNEYELAYQNGLNHFISNRGYLLLLMNNQIILRIESLCILVIPLVIVYLDFKKRMLSSPYRNIISTSKQGEKLYGRNCDRIFIEYVLINYIAIFIGHIIKIKKYFIIDFTYTLKDVLYTGYSIPLWLFFFICMIISTVTIFVISKLIYSVIEKLILK